MSVLWNPGEAAPSPHAKPSPRREADRPPSPTVRRICPDLAHRGRRRVAPALFQARLAVALRYQHLYKQTLVATPIGLLACG